MANRPTAPPNSAGMECYPGTDMTGVEMELLRELMRKAERNKMMTQTLSLNQLEHKHAPDPRQAEWNAQKAAGQWPGWKAAGPPPKSVNPPPASSGRPPNMNFDPNDDPWAAETAVPKADPPILQIFGNVQQGTPPINLPPAATAMGKCGFPEHSAAAMGTESTFPPAKAAAPTAENSAARQLPIPKASGPNKAARNSTPKIEEVPEDGNGGWMKALRGIEMFLRMKMNSLALNIFQQMSHRRGSQITCGEFHPQFNRIRRTGMTRIGTPATIPMTWTQLCLIQCMCEASNRGRAQRSN